MTTTATPATEPASISERVGVAVAALLDLTGPDITTHGCGGQLRDALNQLDPADLDTLSLVAHIIALQAGQVARSRITRAVTPC